MRNDVYDFPIVERKLIVVGIDNPDMDSSLYVPNKRAIVRTDTNEVLGIVGSNYKVLTHEQALTPILDSFANLGVEIKTNIIITASGAKMFAHIYFPQKVFSVGKEDDTVYPGVTVINSLDGTLKYFTEAFLYRTMCENGLRVPHVLVSTKGMHSKNENFDDIVENILEKIGNKEVFDSFSKWAITTVSENEMLGLIDAVIKNPMCSFPARYEDLVRLRAAKEVSFGICSIWGLYNAFNGVLEHTLIGEKDKYERARLLDQNLFKVFSSMF